MSGSLNKVMIIGTLGKDPEIRSIPNGAKVANFSVATNESYTDKSGVKHDSTQWHRVVMWRGLAEVAEKYLRKGSTAYFEGKLVTRSWDDPDGKKRYQTEIVADNMQMLGGKSGGTTQDTSTSQATPASQEPWEGQQQADDDLPF